MHRRFIALLVSAITMLAFGIGLSQPAQAAPAPAAAPAIFVPAPSHVTFNISNVWNPNQPTITVSDRTGQSAMRVSQSAYAWGSLAADNMTMAYTTLTTCTGCIIVTIKPKGDPAITTNIANTSRTVYTDPQTHIVYTKACSVVFQKEYWAAHTDYRQRQRAMTHEIGHCLGYMHANPAYDTCELSIEANVYCAPATRFTPSSYDYSEQSHNY